MRIAVEAAAGIVDEDGVGGLTARRLAARIGYSPGALYTHFRHLEEVLAYVNVFTLKEIRLCCGNAVAGAGDPREALLSLGEAYLDFAGEHPQRVNMLFTRYAHDGMVDEMVRQNVHQLRSLLATEMERLAPQMDARALRGRVSALWSGIHGAAVLAIPDSRPAIGTHRTILETLVDGLSR